MHRGISEAGLIRAVGVHHIDLKIAGAIGGKRNLASVRAEGRVEIISSVVGEAGLIRAVGVHYIDPIAFAGGGKRNIADVRTEGGGGIKRPNGSQAGLIRSGGCYYLYYVVGVAAIGKSNLDASTD